MDIKYVHNMPEIIIGQHNIACMLGSTNKHIEYQSLILIQNALIVFPMCTVLNVHYKNELIIVEDDHYKHVIFKIFH